MTKSSSDPKTATDGAVTKVDSGQSKSLIPYDYSGYEDMGYEHQTRSDVTVPMIVLATYMSPRCKLKPTDPQYVAPGSWVNTVTGQTYSGETGFLFVPATTRQLIAKWVPRKEGGGFRGHLMPTDQIVEAARKRAEQERLRDPKMRYGKLEDGGLQLVETFYCYGSPCTEDGEPDGMAVLAFSSTKIKPYTTWQSRQRMVVNPRTGRKPPMFAHLVRITSREDHNDLGDYHVPVFSPADPRGIRESLLPETDPRFLAGFAVRQLVDSGEAKTNFEAQQDAGDDDDEGGAESTAGATGGRVQSVY